MKSFLSLLLTLFFLVYTCNPASAQPRSVRGYGLKGGITSSYFNTNLDEAGNYTIDGTRGLNAALFVEWNLTRSLSVVTQAGYSQRSFKESIVYQDMIDTPVYDALPVARATSRMDYLSVPILVKLRRSDEKATGYLLGGVGADFLLNKKAGTWVIPGNVQPSPMARGFRPYAVGLVTGAGIEETHLLPTTLLVELRYNLDVTDSLKGSDQFRRDGTPICAFRSALEFSLGVMF